MADYFNTEELAALDDALERVAGGLRNQRTLNRLGLAQVRQLKERTRKGIDVDGNAFPAYDPDYAKLKEAAGLPTAPANLQYGVKKTKGHRDGGLPADAAPVRANMYDSMMLHVDHVVARDLSHVEVLVTKPAKERLMQIHSFEGPGGNKAKIRKAWGISKPEADRAQDLVTEDITELLQLADLS